MDYTITLDPARQDLDTIHRALAGTYWSPGIRREVVAEAPASLRSPLRRLAVELADLAREQPADYQPLKEIPDDLADALQRVNAALAELTRVPLIGAWLPFDPAALPDWLGDAAYTKPAVAFVVFWRYLGWNVVLYLSALQVIDKDLYEAATIDGAGGDIFIPSRTIRRSRFRPSTTPNCRMRFALTSTSACTQITPSSWISAYRQACPRSAYVSGLISMLVENGLFRSPAPNARLQYSAAG